MNLFDRMISEFDCQSMSNPDAKFVRVTCEQMALCYEDEKPTNINGLRVVLRGSIPDCNMREAKPRPCYIDLTKVE